MTPFTPYSGSVPASLLTGSPPPEAPPRLFVAGFDVKLGNFGRNPNKRQYAYILTPAGLEEKTRITLAFLKRKEAEFVSIRREIAALKREVRAGSGKQDT